LHYLLVFAKIRIIDEKKLKSIKINNIYTSLNFYFFYLGGFTMTRNKVDQLKSLDEKINQLKSKKLQIEKEAKEEERKKRTRELIQIGAIMNSLGIETIEHAESFKKNLNSSPDILNWFNHHFKSDNFSND
jgi:Pyruvate/2-oxoacid:ferredoxin oxidoreductase gamma subunit